MNHKKNVLIHLTPEQKEIIQALSKERMPSYSKGNIKGYLEWLIKKHIEAKIADGTIIIEE